MIRTIEQARRYVLRVKLCTVMAAKNCPHPSLWDQIDLPDKRPGEKGWGQKVAAMWTWKNQLPADYPDEVFYGKIKGGYAALIAMPYLRETHFPAAYRPAESLPPLAQAILQKLRSEPRETTELRRELVDEQGCTKSQFDTALKNLQITMNVVRSNDPAIECDTWLPFGEQYPAIWETRKG